MTNEGTIDILVVEGNESERSSIVSALNDSIPDVRVASTQNGEEALDFLFGRGKYEDRIHEDPPKLVLMDLEMPEVNGISVLGQIRSLEPIDSLTLTPIVVFTDSAASGDINETYRCGANSYIIKPLSFPDFQTVVEAVGRYWMTYNQRST